MPSLAPPAELLLALSQVLTNLRAGWYVGAQAVMHWGRPRLTEDIDVTVQLGTVETARLVARAGRVDLAAVRQTLAMLEDAIGVSDLIPMFDRLVNP